MNMNNMSGTYVFVVATGTEMTIAAAILILVSAGTGFLLGNRSKKGDKK